jgi:hypothetical protein
MPCPNGELNSQIKGLQSRITQLEDDINAHYSGISQLVLSLSANPFTSASVAASAVIYNLQPMGMKLLRSLLQALIPKELQRTMRLLTMLSAANIEDLAEGMLENIAAQTVGAVNGIIDQTVLSALNDLASIEAELATFGTDVINASVNSLSDSLTQKLDLTVQENIMQSAFNDWQNAVDNALGSTVIAEKRKIYLEAWKTVATLKSGAIGLAVSSLGSIGGVTGSINNINKELKKINDLLGFVVIQDDITTCKSKNLFLLK